MIQANVAIYPLQQDTNAAIERAIAVIEASGLQCEVRSMQTELLGPQDEVFATLRAAFAAAAEVGPTVMNATISNACPLPGA
ncbi:MAG: thiamine-binding protein [Dehalococcoidia bacterium]|nr:thiamine-binding protein [Dehalococcoidia bacterium]